MTGVKEQMAASEHATEVLDSVNSAMQDVEHREDEKTQTPRKFKRYPRNQTHVGEEQSCGEGKKKKRTGDEVVGMDEDDDGKESKKSKRAGEAMAVETGDKHFL